jgi:hypothetical protein
MGQKGRQQCKQHQEGETDSSLQSLQPGDKELEKANAMSKD